jgi:hypothetical protein
MSTNLSFSNTTSKLKPSKDFSRLSSPKEPYEIQSYTKMALNTLLEFAAAVGETIVNFGRHIIRHPAFNYIAVCAILYYYRRDILAFLILGYSLECYIVGPIVAWTVRHLIVSSDGEDDQGARIRMGRFYYDRIRSVGIIGWSCAFEFMLRRPRDVLPSSLIVAMGHGAGRVMVFNFYALVIIWLLSVAASFWMENRIRKWWRGDVARGEEVGVS